MSFRLRCLVFALGLSAAASTLAAPPSNFSGQVKLCNNRLQAKADIVFGQSGTTASVQSSSEQVKPNPFGGVEPGETLGYSVFVAASYRPNSQSTWSVLSTQQDGVVGYAQPPISIGRSTFKSATCELKGTAIVSADCPTGSTMSHDQKTVERIWVGCGL